MLGHLMDLVYHQNTFEILPVWSLDLLLHDTVIYQDDNHFHMWQILEMGTVQKSGLKSYSHFQLSLKNTKFP